MRAALSLTPREVRLEERAEPVAGDDEVVCAVLACGVCASDVNEAYVARKLPRVIGHEIVGEVLAVGADVRHRKVGERVVVAHHVPCGECRRCRRGHETLCRGFRTSNVDPGGFAERIRVPGELVGELLPLDGLDPLAASFAEPLGCVLRALDRLALQGGESLLVVGAGSAGLLAIAAAHARAVEAVWVREPRAGRLERALALGAERHGDELVDAALVCAPGPRAIAEAAAALAPGGTLCVYAVPDPGTPLPLDVHDLFTRELAVHASWGAGPADIRAAVALLRAGRVDPRPLVTHRLPLAETGRGLELTRRGETLKAVVEPWR